jgi:hypothetical protein
MDMMKYASLTGLAIWAGIGRELAPFPDTTLPFNHYMDFCFAPCLFAVEVKIPQDALNHLLSYQNDRQVRKVIESVTTGSSHSRVATASIKNSIILGSLSVLPLIGFEPEASRDQLFPTTIHWIYLNNIHWIKQIYTHPIDAYTTDNNNNNNQIIIKMLIIQDLNNNILFEIEKTALLSINDITPFEWELNGLTIQIQTNSLFIQVIEDDSGNYIVSYSSNDIPLGDYIHFNLTAI